MKSQLDALANRHRLFRRLLLIWACWLITVVVLRVTDLEALPKITAPVATIVTGVLGLLTIVLGQYQRNRQKDDESGQ